jgi:hypothetical protein
MSQYTLTYSAGVEGWPSFYSYIPEYMVGMNQYLYSFNGGNLYRHNTNESRNNFYGTPYSSTMTSVFNDSPLENKIFKTLNLESDDPWDATMISDIQTTGYIDEEWFVKKEASWFAFVRNSGENPAATSEYALRSLNGIGSCVTVSTELTVSTINFALTTNIGSIISVGDTVYSFVPPVPPVVNSTPTIRGIVTAIEVDLKNSINRLVIATAAHTPPASTDYIMFVKDQVAESHGVLGHYCQFTITLNKTTRSELFAVESEVIKSFP